MSRAKRRVLGICAALIGCALPGLQASSAEEALIVAHDLKQLRVPGKVDAVLWTVRADECTLQVVFLNIGRLLAIQTDQATGERLSAEFPPRPQVEAWLLRADGTVIAPGKSQLVGAVGFGSPHGVEHLFSFPLEVQREAVAVAIRVDGEQRVEKLEQQVGTAPGREVRLSPSITPRQE